MDESKSHFSSQQTSISTQDADIEPPSYVVGIAASVGQLDMLELFFDATPAIRFGISGQYTEVHYLDGNQPHNIRGMGQAVYVF